MFVYLLVFPIALYYLYFAENYNNTRSTKLLAFFLGFLALFIGMGDMIGGYDRYIYGDIFDGTYDLRISGKSMLEIIYRDSAFSEKGYMVLNYLLSFFTANRYIFILLTTIVMYVMYYYAIKKYAPNYPMACLLFLGFFYYFTATYLRQALAVGIIWLSVDSIINRKVVTFFILSFLAFSFHHSALIFLPMYFLGTRKYSMGTIWMFLSVCLIAGLSSLPDILIGLAGDAADLEERFRSSGTFGGVRYEYIIEVLFFLWVLYKNRNSMPTDRKSIVFLNLFYAFCGLLLLFVRMGQGGRFGWYFMIGIIYILSVLSIQRSAIKEMKTFVISLCFLLFFRITSGWAFNLAPYKTFLTDGYPSGERYIYEKYEYDGKYKNDKFYRDPWLLW